MKTETAKLVKFGRGGDTVYTSRHSTTSGYGSPERPHAARPHLAGDGYCAALEIPDGCPVVDTREATETDAGYRWAFQGPLVDVELMDGAVDRLREPSSIMASAMLSGGGEFGAILAGQMIARAERPAEPGPLDSVPIGRYVAGWREHGARIGRYKGGQIVWEAKA